MPTFLVAERPSTGMPLLLLLQRQKPRMAK
jgi:hypothetical protein